MAGPISLSLTAAPNTNLDSMPSGNAPVGGLVKETNLRELTLDRTLTARACRLRADGQRTNSSFAVVDLTNIIDKGRAVVVKDVTCTERFDVLKVLRRRGGDDLVARRSRQLDSVAADA